MGINYLKSRVFGFMIFGEFFCFFGKRVKIVFLFVVIFFYFCYNFDILGKRVIYEYRYVYVQQWWKIDLQFVVVVFGILVDGDWVLCIVYYVY